MKIRKFLSSDEMRCCDIIKSCFWDGVLLDDKAKKYIIDKFTTEGFLSSEKDKYDIFVCEFEDVVCGMGAIEGSEIKRIYVDPDFYGRGIGGKILEYLENFGRESGVLEFVLHSYDNAVSFYEKRGYRVVGDYEFDFPNLDNKVFVAEMKKEVLL